MLSNDVSHKQICHLYQILWIACEQKSALGINTISPISIDKSTLGHGLCMAPCLKPGDGYKT